MDVRRLLVLAVCGFRGVGVFDFGLIGDGDRRCRSCFGPGVGERRFGGEDLSETAWFFSDDGARDSRDSLRSRVGECSRIGVGVGGFGLSGR